MGLNERGPTLRPGLIWVGHRNPAELLYGALVTGTVFALSASATDEARTVGLTVLEVLVAFWVAHVYTRLLTDRLRDPAASFMERGREAINHERAVLEGGLPALVAFVLANLVGASTSRAVDVALAVTVVLLGSAGYHVGRAVGARGITLVGEIAVAVLLGLFVVGLKLALH